MAAVQQVRRSGETWPVPTVYSALAVTSLATAGIHFAVMSEHFAEYALFGVFFSLVAWFQALWALGIVMAPIRPLLLTGAVVNTLVVLVWVVSRTTGLPIGPDRGIAESAAFLDVLSTVLEVVIVAATAALLLRGRPARSRKNGLLLVGGLVVGLILLTTFAVAAADEGHGHADTTTGTLTEEEAGGTHTEEEAGGAHAEEGETNHAEGEDTGEEGTPELTTVDLGDGRTLQAIFERSAGNVQFHLTFFGANGAALRIGEVEVTGVSASGDEAVVPVELFEPGHYAATVDLAPGEWEFDVHGHLEDGGEISTSFQAQVP